jgi:hypothetical protein
MLIFIKKSSKFIYPPIQRDVNTRHKIKKNNDTKNNNVFILNQKLDKYSKKVNINNNERYKNANKYQYNNFVYETHNYGDKNNEILNNNNYRKMYYLLNKKNHIYSNDNKKIILDNFKLKTKKNKTYKNKSSKKASINDNKAIEPSSGINMKEEKFKKLISSTFKIKQIIKRDILKNLINKWKNYSIKKYNNKYSKKLILQILKTSNNNTKKIYFKRLIIWKNKINNYNYNYNLEIKKKYYFYFINLLIKKLRKNILFIFFMVFY